MVKVMESPESAVNETENIIQECRERIRQALEADSNKLKEKAELDSNQIIAGAREEAAKIISQARHQSTLEAEQIITGAKEQAEQISRKSLEEAAAARHESAKIISETREKAWQIITEVIERGTTQAQSEFARAASEARSKTSLLLTQVNKGVDEIIAESENVIKSELERLAAVISEAEAKLQPLSEIPAREPELRMPPLAEKPPEEVELTSPPADMNTVAPPAPVEEKTHQSISSIGHKRGALPRDSDETRLFKGRHELEIVHPYNQEQTGGVPEWLAHLTGLNVVPNGSYASGNRRISNYTVNLEQPIHLLKILRHIPRVKDVCEQKGTIMITL